MSQSSLGLLTVQGDTEYMLVRRRGRFAMERAQAANPKHRSAAVKAAMGQMVLSMAKRGYEYVDDGWVEVIGNLPHVEYDDSIAPDLGPLAQPHPLDLKLQEAFSRTERLKAALDVPDPETDDLIDFRVIATFKKAKRKTFLPKLRG